MPTNPPNVVIIGAGPAGLMAAEQLNHAGFSVNVYEAMPSIGRKFLRAGIGGLNLSHAEDNERFLQRYGEQQAWVGNWLKQFNADDVRQWAGDLGIETFVGSSGRIFPKEMKAAPLLRAWLKRLRRQGTRIHLRHRWLGWDKDRALRIENPDGQFSVTADIVIFALGGGSWARLGSNGLWQPTFADAAIECHSFRPSNIGFDVNWRAPFKKEQQGQPLKSVGLKLQTRHGKNWHKRGEAMISKHGIEGSLIYAASAEIRDQIDQQGHCDITWDLLPDKTPLQLQRLLSHWRPKASLSSFLRSKYKLDSSKQALLNQLTTKEQVRDRAALPHLVKNLPQRLESYRPIDEAISTAGGVCQNALTNELMLSDMPGHYCVGEMLDWEAPTGGYLLTACFASGVVAGRAAAKRLQPKKP